MIAQKEKQDLRNRIAAIIQWPQHREQSEIDCMVAEAKGILLNNGITDSLALINLLAEYKE
jgi:hypothetical protein